MVLDLPEIGNDARAEHRFVEFRTHDAVAMLPGMRALVFAHHRKGFFGDGPHRLDVFFQFQVEHRAHMQAAFRGMRIHGAAGAVPGEDGVEPFGIVCEMRQRHREAGGANLGDACLQGGLCYLDHAAPFALRVIPAKAEIGHQLAELLQAPDVLGLSFLGEFDDQHRVGIAAHRGADDGLEHRDFAAQRDHGAIDQFDRDRAQFYEMLSRIHGFIKTAEMADAQDLVADHRPQLQFDLRGESQGALGSHQQMRHVVRRIARHQRIEIIAADAALHFWKFPGDFSRLAFAKRQHVAEQIEATLIRIQLLEVARHLAEMQQGAVGKGSIHRARVVAHGAVSQRTPAAGIIAGHAADGGAGGGGNVDRKPQPVLFELPVEVVEHDPRFDHAGSIFDVQRDDAA